MLRVLVAAVLVVAFVTDVDARPRRRRARTYASYNYGWTTTTTSSYGGGPQEVATAKAQQAASWGAKGHIGGGYGGANAEGVGFSAYSAQQALNNCCFTGQRSVAGSAVVRGNDGWYAVKIFW